MSRSFEFQRRTECRVLSCKRKLWVREMVQEQEDVDGKELMKDEDVDLNNSTGEGEKGLGQVLPRPFLILRNNFFVCRHTSMGSWFPLSAARKQQYTTSNPCAALLDHCGGQGNSFFLSHTTP